MERITQARRRGTSGNVEKTEMGKSNLKYGDR